MWLSQNTVFRHIPLLQRALQFGETVGGFYCSFDAEVSTTVPNKNACGCKNIQPDDYIIGIGSFFSLVFYSALIFVAKRVKHKARNS